MEALWRQFGAAIDMLENAMRACPPEHWGSNTPTAFWYHAYHTLFWLDFYMSDPRTDFAPPAPFDLAEMDPAGLMPPRVFTREELLAYLEHDRAKCRAFMAGISDEHAAAPHLRARPELSPLEMHLYNLRHVQHHTAQLNLLLRQQGGTPPKWVGRAAIGLDSA